MSLDDRISALSDVDARAALMLLGHQMPGQVGEVLDRLDAHAGRQREGGQ